MIISESQCHAILKKNLKVQTRRSATTIPVSCKSRKRWLMSLLDSIYHGSLIISHAEEHNHLIIVVLNDLSETSGELTVVIHDINKKKCTLIPNITLVNFSKHSIWRLMQYRRTDDLKVIAPELGDIFGAIVPFDAEYFTKTRKLVVPELGIVVVDTFEEMVTIKTFIHAEALTGENLKLYEQSTV